MPVYKGNNEVTSGNLYKGTTEIQDGYKATDPFYVNEVTLVISFVNNTNLSSSSSLTRTIVGVPGNSFSTQQFIVTASSSQRVNSLSFSESGDTQSIATCSTSGVNQNGGNYNVTGTFPTISQTITFTLTASVTFLPSAQSYVSQGQSLQPHSGTWSISDSPSFGTSVNSSNQIVCQANGGDTQYKGTAATTVTFGSAGQSAGYSVSISKASGYYIASSSGSNTYMEYT
jgi:hypothetical protein